MWFIIRHGETLHNKKKIKQGRYSSLLTLKGIDQIKSIAYRMSNLEDDFSDYIFVSSPMIRTMHSIQIIQECLNMTDIKIEQDELLAEIDTGDYTNKKKSDILKENPNFFEKKKNNFLDFQYPNGENYGQVYDRFLKFVNKNKEANENMIILTHGCGIRFIPSILSGVKKEDFKYEEWTETDQNYFHYWEYGDNIVNKV